MIPPNLLEALAVLRLQESVRTLWVDALCINQEDSEEKSVQIPMMSRIYRRAKKVCIWLGPDEHHGAAIQFIKSEVLKLESFEALVQIEGASAGWSAIIDMLQREWFIRRWILQEILFARDSVVYYGSESILWQDFADAVSLFLKVQISTRAISDIMKTDPSYYHVPGWLRYASDLGAGIMIGTSQSLFRVSSDGKNIPLRGLESLVHECQMFQNSESRDTIYALLGLANDTTGIDAAQRDRPYLQSRDVSISGQSQRNRVDPEPKAYPVNYVQSYASHCKDFVEFVIRQCSRRDKTRALDILCRPWAPIPTAGRRLPSWVSTLSEAAFDIYRSPGTSILQRVGRKNCDPLVGPPQSNRSIDSTYYAASRDRGVDLSAMLFQENPNHYSLHISGFIFDSVEEVEVSSQGGVVPAAWVEAFGVGTEDGDTPLPDELWRLLVADRGPNGGTLPAYYKRACKEVIRRCGLRSGAMNLTGLVENEGNPLITDFCQRVLAVVWNRSMIRTRGGRLGLARKHVRKDDLICILYGCSVPVMLRKHVENGQENVGSEQTGVPVGPEEEKTFYELLGECYVYGIMDGEAIEFQEKNSIKSELFELR